jgi:hypothetical protein
MVVNMDPKKMLFLQLKCDARLRIGRKSVSLDRCIAKEECYRSTLQRARHVLGGVSVLAHVCEVLEGFWSF